MFVYVPWRNAEYDSFGITVETVYNKPQYLPATVCVHLSLL